MFKKGTNAHLSFHWIKGFENKINESCDYPVLLKRDSGQNTVILKRQDLSGFGSVENLILRIEMIVKSSS